MHDNKKNLFINSSRRSFLKNSGLVLLASSLASPLAASSVFAGQKSIIKVGLIGCGGRGTGAAAQAMKADPNVELTAMGDVFPDRLEGAYSSLEKINPKQLKVDKKNRFIGFDAYQKVIDSGVDVVLLTAPPGFRPLHLEAAVEAGKHIFCEKPVAVDAPGVRKVIELSKKAKEKNLSLVSGFCFRYDNPNRATFTKVLEGDVGGIKAITTFRNGGEVWYFPREEDWTEMTYQMRNWYYYNWLSGDFIVEQAVHSLDMMSWAMGDVMPVSAMGTGGRQVRVDPQYGNIYDHFAVEFEYKDGAKGYHFTRQQAGTTNRNSVDVMGTAGNAIVNIGSQYEIKGQKPWKFSGQKNNMYQTQHDELFASIRSGRPIHDGDYMANSTLLAIWGRMVAYTGQRITFEEALNSPKSLGPDVASYTWDLKIDMPPIAVPGVTKIS
ncbi:Gfo/Idh/MocA family protein [Albibacterium indicum]|uniref:Gfo/Idh/MocA family protein n=1 Tax=Albibacterium indicum TaxID=2292082 RepID=UPI000E50FF0A|nr:Gfo/Idh/MocA family oxidoreductase [Pedobacter indicus]